MTLELLKDGGMGPTEPIGPAAVIITEDPKPVQFGCLNGPCQGSWVDAPSDATPGTACALPWKTTRGENRFAVYVLVDHNGSRGLMFLTSHHKPEYAQSQVVRITALCAAGVS